MGGPATYTWLFTEISRWCPETNDAAYWNEAARVVRLEIERSAVREYAGKASPLEANGNVMSTKILIVDDHPLVRQGLIGLLSTQPDFEVCGEASGIGEARELVAVEVPDVAIVDLTL